MPPAEIQLSDNSRQVLRKRYLRKGLDGQPIEDIPGMFRRVAHAVAEPDATYGYDVQSTEDTFYGLLAGLRFFPNSPTFTGAGTPLGQLAACFVLPISDDLGRNSDGIFQTLRDAALIQQTGGGNGFSFSRCAPRTTPSPPARASRPARSASCASTISPSARWRKAARDAAPTWPSCAWTTPISKISSPARLRKGRSATSTSPSASPMRSCRPWRPTATSPLVSPRNGSVWRTVRARDLFDKIVTYAHHNGEPGALFLDAANRANPVPHLYDTGSNKSVRRTMVGSL